MLTGRTDLPPGFNPSVAAAGRLAVHRRRRRWAVTRPRNNLPPAAVLPERLVHNTGRVIPGQFAGLHGSDAQSLVHRGVAVRPAGYGAYPEYGFDHQERPGKPKEKVFQAPSLSLPEGVAQGRLDSRLSLLQQIDRQRRDLDRMATVESFDAFRQGALSLLTDPRVRAAFDVTRAPEKVQERYGRNAFGWSLLMARRLVEAGVNLVQVNLGNNETWDTHGNAFPHLKDKLFPPTDRALSALLDDLNDSGLLDEHADRDGRRVRSHAEGHAPAAVLQAAGPRPLGSGADRSSSRAAASRAAPWSAPPTASAATRRTTRKRRKTWPRPSTTPWASRPRPSGATREERPHHVYHGEPIRGLL